MAKGSAPTMTKREIKADGKRLFDAYRATPSKATQDAIDSANLEVQADVLRRAMKRHDWAIKKALANPDKGRHSVGVMALGGGWPYSLPARLLNRRVPLMDIDLINFIEPLTRSRLIDPSFDAVWFSTYLRYLNKRHATGQALPAELIEPLKIVRGFVRTTGWQAKDGRKLKASINETIKLIKKPPAETEQRTPSRKKTRKAK
ncbi:MAG: hypothetical protein AAGH92_03185 [Planctomycetota bacterium]